MSRTLFTRSPHTSADWWVTAEQSRHDAQGGLADATTAPDLLRTLAELDRARRSTATAVGAAVEALLAAGTPWEEITAVLGLASVEDARRATAPARHDAARAIGTRLGHRAADQPAAG